MMNLDLAIAILGVTALIMLNHFLIKSIKDDVKTAINEIVSTQNDLKRLFRELLDIESDE